MVDKTSMLIEGVGIDVYYSLFAYLESCSHCLLILPTMHCFVFFSFVPSGKCDGCKISVLSN